MNLAEMRDLVIVIFGIAAIVTLFAILIVTLVVGFAARGLISILKTTIQEEVTPTVRSVRQSTDNVRGATAFVAEMAASPIIRAYGIFAGIRRALAVISGLVSRRRP